MFNKSWKLQDAKKRCFCCFCLNLLGITGILKKEMLKSELTFYLYKSILI